MGPVKAALESSVRYMASELAVRNIRVNALSPGPIFTRAASGIAHFDALAAWSASQAPLRELVDIDGVGAYARFLVSDAAKMVTGNTAYIDAGCHAMG